MSEAPNDLLCEAARSGDVSTLTSLIAAGADVTYFDDTNLNPLMHAAKHGHADVVHLLLSHGAPWNALTPSGVSAGDFAMENSHQDAFDVLLNAGVQSELVLGTIARNTHPDSKPTASSDYLEERVRFGEDRIMDSESKAVMMAWELPLMEAHARAICSGGDGVSVLNVGFGIGLVDTAIQRYNVGRHTIIEAHPEVFDRMLKKGWGEKENVKILFGKWQDILPQLESYDGK